MACSYFFAAFPLEDELDAFMTTAERLQTLCALIGPLVRPQKLHMTLAYVGRYVTRVLELEDQLRQLGDRVSFLPGALLFDRALTLDGGGPTRASVFTPSSTPTKLHDAALELADACASLGTGERYSWSPHVTWLYSPDTLPKGVVLAPPVSMTLYSPVLAVGEDGKDYKRIADWAQPLPSV